MLILFPFDLKCGDLRLETNSLSNELASHYFELIRIALGKNSGLVNLRDY